MASQQAFQQYTNTNKGTLQPGQTISVNKYNVQVERYLSQGGFAHVYLVRTAVPVYNTTHHVLKRIAVANDGMLSEVKKEVDIMRILKGHPNIVHLIDAAWHRMPNGMYEVFILMEFCAGGGIIDMMNRRLRERLTEAEILQIFVDVCEGVAAMHNLRPALLHRDLKVENILQSTTTSFKLCDFGSATPVAVKPPSSMQEIRALEADLNRHTTLQYRAPEMVDPYLRRPVDEKSDVWALGVLLYKLCYYTTPFEEHGPLAILNAQYKTPPYPVYSMQMNALIGECGPCSFGFSSHFSTASMLREHGAHRPSVFEMLNHVHRLRGTKSRFTYTVPSPQPLSPRQQVAAPATNPLNDIVSFRPNPSAGNATGPKNPGVQAREKVLEAIAPMRRGRPTSAQTPPESKSRPASPQKEKAQQNRVQNWLDDSFAVEEDKAWKAMKNTQAGAAPVRGHRSGPAPTDAWKVKSPVPPSMDPAWSTEARAKDPSSTEQLKLELGGFDNGFAEKLWDQFDGAPMQSSSVKPVSIPARPVPGGSDSTGSVQMTASRKAQDAFDGLGLSPSDRPPPQTLGEARKTRTGLSPMNGSTSSLHVTPSEQASRPSSSLAPRPTPSPRPVQASPAPTPNSSSWKPSSGLAIPKSNSSAPTRDVSPESRFPSLEELDSQFSPPPPDLNSSSRPAASRQPLSGKPTEPPLPIRPRLTSNISGGLRPIRQQTHLKDGVRSQQVTGVAMRDPKGTKAEGVQRRGSDAREDASDGQLKRTRPLRPSLSRRHRSSITIKHTHASGNDVLGSPGLSPTMATISPRAAEPRDWLTGDDDAPVSKQQPPAAETPVLRQFTNKRSSFIESGGDLQSPQEAVTAEQLSYAPAPSPTKSKFASPRPSRTLHSTHNTGMAPELSVRPKPVDVQPSINRSPKKLHKGDSSSDEGPEDVNGFTPPRQLKRTESKKRKGRQSSVTDLVDLWGGGAMQLKDKQPELTRNPHAGDYLAYRPDTQASVQPPARRPSFLPPVSDQRSTSPQPMASPPPAQPVRPTRPQRSPSHHRKLSSAASPIQSSPAGRGRPQSMFIFPVGGSKSDSSTALSSPMLSPPPDSAPSRTRRTSITDMVQRFEAIGGGTKKPETTSPLAAQKPIALKVAINNTSSGNNPRQSKLSLSRTNSPVTARPNGRLDLPSRKSDEPAAARQRNAGLPSASASSPAHRENIWTREVDNMNAPSQRTSHEKPSAPINEAPFADRQSSQFDFPARRPSVPPPAEDSAPPASPEKPYQGVGKLIDQWQRKTTTAPEPDTRRSGFAVRGAGRGRI
ncbi:hypothetical protein FIBSPDRAFT_389100 [Athelia psychrophila]|uniref:non-specific serine/threonine protein kinase n=1 Tax=Athelia psychrophila TaxID=1759441 RepID=A0A166NTZ4_9AGAM|nr:hypothetical protein FIBSPDRAFT_389100 [Fibularhizoctonia sp. CBS 109695]